MDPRQMSIHYPRGEKALIGPLHRWGAEETVRWFEAHGVELKTEPDGRLFPVTNDSQTIIECLQDAAREAGVEVQCQRPVKRLTHDGETFVVETVSGRSFLARHVLLATGGTREASGARLAEGLGHTLIPAVPSLFTFKIADPRLRDLAGVSVPHARATIVGSKLRAEGPLLVTHWGLSGPGILRLSAWGARWLAERDYAFDVIVNWLPEKETPPRFDRWRQGWGKRQIAARSPFDPLPRRLWERLVEAAGIPPDLIWARLTKAQAKSLHAQVHASTFRVQGKSLHKEEFVTCGGVPLKEIHLKTMESRVCPGLYFAGEVLDIDGLTGGFNFQNAWTTGYLAGTAAAS